jgi:threonine aldolase
MAIVNLFSDTQTRPTPEMRAAIAAAEVGDEQLRQDPTVIALEERVAALLGQEAAVFLPSGTMCNEIAIRVHVRPGGDEMFLGRGTHPLVAEGGGPAQLSGAIVTVVEGDSGMFTGEALDAALSAAGPGGRYGPRPRLVCVEQTTNLGGGRVWPRAQMRGVLDVAAARGLMTHLDGARLMNAVVTSGVDAASWARAFDSAWLDLTKGLGAPVGAVLAGSAAFIEEAWRWKQMLGGAMRQAGMIAAAGLYALDHHVERLADDHARARRLAEGLAGLDGVDLEPAMVESNIVIFSVPDAAAFCAALAADDVVMSQFGPHRVRAVTHLDVDDEGIDRALEAAGRAASAASAASRG